MKTRLTINVLAVLALVLMFSTSAFAQATRTWVSGVGDDANPCSRTAPCKTFAGAISKTAANGEIDALDPGGYGALTITKAITIDGGGGQVASVLASGTNGIVVSAGSLDVVVLRNLNLQGVGAGLNGIRYISGAQLHIDHCTVTGFTQSDIDVELSGDGMLEVSHSILTGGNKGVYVTSTSGNVSTTLTDDIIKGVAYGIDTFYGALQAEHCTVTKCSSFGILGEGGGITFANGALTSNGTAVLALSGSIIRLSNDDILDNVTALSLVSGGVVASAGNNREAGNNSGAAPNSTILVR